MMLLEKARQWLVHIDLGPDHKTVYALTDADPKRLPETIDERLCDRLQRLQTGHIPGFGQTLEAGR